MSHQVKHVAAQIEAYLQADGPTRRARRVSGEIRLDPAIDLRRQGVLDSLNLVDFILFLEKEFDCRVPARMFGDGHALSIQSVARWIVDEQVAPSGSRPGRSARMLRIVQAASCVVQETLSIAGRAGGYRGFLALVRELVDPELQLSVVNHPRLRWDELVEDDVSAALSQPDLPRELRELLDQRRFRPEVFREADVIVMDVVHESYLWRVQFGGGRIGEESPGSRDVLLGGMTDASRGWLNAHAQVRPPIGLHDLEVAMRAALRTLRDHSFAPIVLVIGAWHRPRTHFTTEYTGSSFDSALRRYMLSNSFTSPEAFYARLAAIDSTAARVASREGVTVVDGRQEFSEVGQAAFADPIHLNDFGWDILGRALVRAMHAAGVIPSIHAARASAGVSFRSIGARAKLAVQQLTSIEVKSIAIQDVCGLPVQVLRLSKRLELAIEDVEARLRQSSERVVLWGLGAIGDRLARTASARGAAAVVCHGPFLDVESLGSDAWVVAGVREPQFGRAWARAQLGGRLDRVEFLEIADVPELFASGVEGASETRLRHACMVTRLRLVDVECAADSLVLLGDEAMARRVVHLAGPLSRRVVILGACDQEWERRIPQEAVVIVCTADSQSGMLLQQRLQSLHVDVINPDTAWLAEAPGDVVGSDGSGQRPAGANARSTAGVA